MEDTKQLSRANYVLTFYFIRLAPQYYFNLYGCVGLIENQIVFFVQLETFFFITSTLIIWT